MPDLPPKKPPVAPLRPGPAPAAKSGFAPVQPPGTAWKPGSSPVRPAGLAPAAPTPPRAAAPLPGRPAAPALPAARATPARAAAPTTSPTPPASSTTRVGLHGTAVARTFTTTATARSVRPASAKPPGLAPALQHIMPGQWHVGRSGLLKTLLGSCVAVTIWHPKHRVGGMCHYLLPARQRRPNEPLDGRYGDEALELMVQALRLECVPLEECITHLYGGADTMPDGMNSNFNVGERNIEQGWKIIDRYGLNLEGVDVGENIPRTVTLSLDTGEVTMARGQTLSRKS